jgi:hypothetical protein
MATFAGPADIEFEGDTYMRCPEAGSCWQCGAKTQYASISFQAFLCSEECASTMWHSYMHADMRVPNDASVPQRCYVCQRAGGQEVPVS